MNVLLGAAAVVVVWYLAGCIWFPMRSCPMPSCKGGKVWNGRGTAWHPCRWCLGKGARPRLGRRLYESVSGRRTFT